MHRRAAGCKQTAVRFLRRTFFLFFLVSGFCGLVYQVVWLRLAMAHFGVTSAMIAIVLSVFMSGLALGSWAAGALAPRLRSSAASLRAYALVELGIAASGGLVPVLLEAGRGTLLGLGGGLSWGSFAFHAASGAWVALVMLPFCTCMGATFPLALAALRRAEAGERTFSYLYVANVVGATAGTLTSAFVLVELLGFRGTLWLTASLNAALGLGALALSARLPRGAGAGPPAEPAAAAPGRQRRAVLATLFTTGLVSMGLEVVWVRLITPYLGNVVYTFATVLALYLAATFAGSTFYRRRARRGAGERWPALLGWLAPLGLVPLASLDPRVMAAMPGPGAARFFLALGIAPFCALLGYLTPMLVDRWSGGEPRAAGSAYAVNVLGCIVGPLLCGFVLLPRLGERWALGALALALLALALVAGSEAAPKRLALAGAASVVLLAATRDYESLFPDREVRRDGTATVVAHGRGYRKMLLVNGTGMTSLTPITKMMAHVPLVLLPRPPQRGLVICFGMGTSLRSMHSWGMEATAVELVPSVPELFSFFHDDGEAVRRAPNVRIVVDDGRRFLDRDRSTYDVVVIDPPPPLEAAGSSLLYSREFYAAVRRRLAPDGLVAQWIPGDGSEDSATRAAFVLALRESFPFLRAFRSVEGWGYHLLASPAPIKVPVMRVLAARLPPAAAQDLMEWGPQPGVRRQLGAVLRRELSLDDLVAAAPGVRGLRDDRPLNEYFLLRRTLKSGS